LDDVIVCAAAAPLALMRIRLLLQRLPEVSPSSRHVVLRERLAWVERLMARGFPVIWASTAAADTSS
jgi:hypothetical protein